MLTNCCKDSDPEPWYNPAPVNKKSIHDVYVALSYDKGPNTLNRAGYYHKGELVTLNGQADNVDTYANSIYIVHRECANSKLLHHLYNHQGGVGAALAEHA
ncbi:MAG: hypothetical protein II623_05390, partial [Paludibacteraceae bacterium]|nr:hypothetical protein [Paludibacteraceae bacterium]